MLPQRDMFDERPKNPIEKPVDEIDQLDEKIAADIDALERAGLNMERWNEEYEELPDEVEAYRGFHQRLRKFILMREDALATYDFKEGMSDEEKDRIRSFDREVMSVYGQPDNFLGNGGTAEVYEMNTDDVLCVKFITNQELYDESNHMRVESQYLSRVYEATKESPVRTPYLAFLRIHPTEGHSYGMEKVDGASLSQILEFPDKYPDLVNLAAEIDRERVRAELLAFVDEMHEAGVTHGDLFKRNIMLDREGRVFVIDFGKAKTIEFKGDREDAMKSDKYVAEQALREFFAKLDELTDTKK